MYIQYCTNWWYKHLKVVIWIILYLKRSLVEYLAIYIYQTCNLVLLASTLNHIGVTLPTRYYCFKHINVYVENLLRYYVMKNWNWMFKKKTVTLIFQQSTLYICRCLPLIYKTHLFNVCKRSKVYIRKKSCQKILKGIIEEIIIVWLDNDRPQIL